MQEIHLRVVGMYCLCDLFFCPCENVSNINQLINLMNDIPKSFDNRKSLETRAVFLDISKAFDKV